MHRSPTRGSFLPVAVGLGLLASAAPAVAAPATGELVSRADGIAGKPYAFADLQAASANGRYVVFRGSIETGEPATLVIRDRTAGTTSVLTAGETPVDPSDWIASEVTDDGSRVLLGYWDGTVRKQAVLTVATKTWKQLDAPEGSAALPNVSFARFLDGGSAVLFSGATADGKLVTYKQTGDAAPQLVASGVQVTGATRSGNVLVWSRPLVAAKRPAGNHGTPAQRWPEQRAGLAVGYTVAGGTPTVVARTTVTERTNAPGQYCVDGGVSAVIKTPALAIDDYGHRLELTTSTFDENYPNTSKTMRVRYDLAEDGSRELWATRTFGYPFDLWGGATGSETSPALPELRGYPDAWTYDARFFAHDSGILREELEDPQQTGSPRVIFAYAPVSERNAPEARTPAALDGELADSPSLAPDVTWGECAPAEPFHLAADFGVYATVNLASPASSRAAAGTVFLKRGWEQGDRPASRVQLQVKTLGFITWSRTVDWTRQPEQTATIQLPRPWLFVPQSLTVKVIADKGNPTSNSPAESIQKSYRWTATR